MLTFSYILKNKFFIHSLKGSNSSPMDSPHENVSAGFASIRVRYVRAKVRSVRRRSNDNSATQKANPPPNTLGTPPWITATMCVWCSFVRATKQPRIETWADAKRARTFHAPVGQSGHRFGRQSGECVEFERRKTTEIYRPFDPHYGRAQRIFDRLEMAGWAEDARVFGLAWNDRRNAYYLCDARTRMSMLEPYCVV